MTGANSRLVNLELVSMCRSPGDTMERDSKGTVVRIALAASSARLLRMIQSTIDSLPAWGYVLTCPG
jgi:hypothetical protein